MTAPTRLMQKLCFELSTILQLWAAGEVFVGRGAFWRYEGTQRAPKTGVRPIVGMGDDRCRCFGAKTYRAYKRQRVLAAFPSV